jgi:hypothetical protein
LHSLKASFKELNSVEKVFWESWGKCHFDVNATSYKIYYREEGGASS